MKLRFKSSKVVEGSGVTGFKHFSASKGEFMDPVVSWVSVGAVSIDIARKQAMEILRICDKVEKGEWDE